MAGISLYRSGGEPKGTARVKPPPSQLNARSKPRDWELLLCVLRILFVFSSYSLRILFVFSSCSSAVPLATLFQGSELRRAPLRGANFLDQPNGRCRLGFTWRLPAG